MAQLINLGGVQPVDEGEALVVQYLANVLPSTYLLYPNLELTEPGRQPYEYDLVVVAPHAVYVVEIKRWLGQISGGDYKWLLSSGQEKVNPLRLTNHKARVLKSRLVRFASSLKSVWVEACVVIANEHTKLHLTGAAAERTFLYPAVVNFLSDPVHLHRGERPIAPNELAIHRTNIRDAIEQEARIRTRAPHQIGHYTVVETLARTDLTDEYLVQNNLLPNAPVVRLRMYTFSPYMNSAQRDSQLHRIKRDAFALQSIGANQNLLAINDFFADDAGHFIEITPWSEQGTLRDVLERGQSLNFDEKVHILIGIARGLAMAHSKGVIHRDLRPENILLDTNLTPRLMNFDHSRIELPNQATVWRPPVPDADRRYLAPELDQPTHTATPASDLYALGAIIYELFSGNVPFTDIAARQKAGGVAPSLTSLVPDLPSDLVNLAFTLYQVDPTARHYNAFEVIRMLELLLQPPALSVVDSESQLPTEYPLHYRVGEEIDGRFKVLAVLGSGGFGQVYKVFHDVTSEVYAMKVINGNYSMEQLKEEYQILKALEHPNIARVCFADRIHPTQFYLLMELIEGELLTTFISPKNLLPLQEVIRLIGQLLQALDYIHQPNRERIAELRRKGKEEELTQEEFEELQKASSRYLHRDIKPGNLMLDRHGNLKLIDFNIAARLNSQLRYTLVGTPNYMAPDIQMLGWDESVDLFAVGVVVYEMITGHYPFPGTPQMGSEPENPQTYRSDLTDEFAQFLRKAIQPARELRFRTAQEMYIDLQAIADHLMPSPAAAYTPTFQTAELEDGQGLSGAESSNIELEAWERDKPNYNPYVTRLLTLYSQARYTNVGTRGLDPIARATYINTWLDERLLPDILSGKHRLVIITGNAGDGKTAFIQQLEAEAVLKGSVVQSCPSNNGKRFHLAGLDFETNYDGSQDEGDKPNDHVLDDFLAPFAGTDPFASSDTSARIIAINEGRLRDFLHAYRSRYPYLQKVVFDFLDFVDVESTLEGSLLIVNLNWRSVVVGNENSILSLQIKKLVDPKFWVTCQSCDFKERCFIKANASRIADSSGGGQIVERLRSLFEVVYLRRRLHITMRDMRSVLSYILLRDHSCDDIAHLLSDNVAPLDYLKYFYYNAIAAPDEPAHELERSSGQTREQPEEVDRLLRQLVQIDPALVANPGDDRAIYFATSKQLATSPLLGFDNSGYDRELLNQVHVALQNEESYPMQRSDLEVLNNRLLYHAMTRRKSFFERRDTGWRAMLPYRYIQDFIKLTDASGQHSSEQELKSKIAFAISRSAGMRQRDYAGKNVVLRASTTAKASIKSYRLFPLEEFSLHTPKLGKLAAYVEYTPDRLLFQHRDKSVRLTISLDLFELLSQISDGMVPSPADIQGYFLNLTIFKNALAHLPYREVLLTENDLQFYRVWLDDKDILHLAETPKEHN